MKHSVSNFYFSFLRRKAECKSLTGILLLFLALLCCGNLNAESTPKPAGPEKTISAYDVFDDILTPAESTAKCKEFFRNNTNPLRTVQRGDNENGNRPAPRKLFSALVMLSCCLTLPESSDSPLPATDLSLFYYPDLLRKSLPVRAGPGLC